MAAAQPALLPAENNMLALTHSLGRFAYPEGYSVWHCQPPQRTPRRVCTFPSGAPMPLSAALLDAPRWELAIAKRRSAGTERLQVTVVMSKSLRVDSPCASVRVRMSVYPGLQQPPMGLVLVLRASC